MSGFGNAQKCDKNIPPYPQPVSPFLFSAFTLTWQKVVSFITLFEPSRNRNLGLSALKYGLASIILISEFMLFHVHIKRLIYYSKYCAFMFNNSAILFILISLVSKQTSLSLCISINSRVMEIIRMSNALKYLSFPA